MSTSSRPHAILVPWRKICGALPAVAMIGAGIVFAAQVAPAHEITSDAVSGDSPAIVVPDIALSLPAPARISADRPAASPEPVAPVAPATVPPDGTLPQGSSLVTLDGTGIPVRALEGYRAAATLVDAADPRCHIDWALLAAIGRVESDHARFGGNELDSSGVARPGIIGIALDGSNGTARILDSDGGVLDQDTVYDRAVGPMQFIPSTWRVVGADADGDGVKNPQDMTDAATSSAIYLCSGHGDLSQPGELSAAILRYNHSDPYVRTVTAIANAYRNGVFALPASDVPAANVVRSRSVVARVTPLTAAPGVTRAPAPTDPTTPDPTTSDPTTSDPTTSDPTTSDPTTSDPTTSDPTTSDPTTSDPATPDPCVPMTGPTAPAPTSPEPTSPGPTDPQPTASCPTPTAATPPPTVTPPPAPTPTT